MVYVCACACVLLLDGWIFLFFTVGLRYAVTLCLTPSKQRCSLLCNSHYYHSLYTGQLRCNIMSRQENHTLGLIIEQ